jgi:hypothetical protein
MHPEKPNPDLAPAGQRLWDAVAGQYELEQHEERLLLEAARTADLLDALAAEVAEDGPMLGDKVHPAVVELRQQRILLARLLTALRVPLGGEAAETSPTPRLPERRGVRGTYAPRVS